MIVIFVSRAFLRPSPLVIFTANFFPDCWISHIEDAEDETTQMGEVRDASPRSLHGREEFDETEDDYKVLGGYWEEEIDVDQSIGKEPPKGEKDSVDGSGGSNDRHELIGRKDHGADARTDSAIEKVS